MGALQMYDLRCELFEFSNEVFTTGVQEIDHISASRITTANNTIAGVESLDPLADNLTIENVADQVLDFSASNPFGDDNY
jgi:hypothetical protein